MKNSATSLLPNYADFVLDKIELEVIMYSPYYVVKIGKRSIGGRVQERLHYNIRVSAVLTGIQSFSFALADALAGRKIRYTPY